MLSLIPFTLLPTAEYDRIVATLGVLGLDASSTPESARAMIGAFKSEGRAEAHRERVEALRAEAEEIEAVEACLNPRGRAADIDMARRLADTLGEPLPAPLDEQAMRGLVHRVCVALQAAQRQGKPTETRRADIALDDVRLMVAGALFEPTAPTADPNDVVRLVRRLVEAHTAVKTTLLESAKASAMALLTDMDRAKTDPEGVIREAAHLAAQGRCALATLMAVRSLNDGTRKPSQADAAAYECAAKDADRDGRHLMAAADRAVAHFGRLLMAYADRDQQARTDRAEDYKVIDLHQGIAKDLGDIVNQAMDQLDALGVPRLPAPLDQSIALRIQVLTSMRERVVLGVDHGAGPDKSAWTVASVK